MTEISALIKEVGELRAMVEVSEAKQDQIEEEAARQAEQRAAEIAALKATTAQCSKALSKLVRHYRTLSSLLPEVNTCLFVISLHEILKYSSLSKLSHPCLMMWRDSPISTLENPALMQSQMPRPPEPLMGLSELIK